MIERSREYADILKLLDKDLNETLFRLVREQADVAQALDTLERVGRDHEVADMPISVRAYINRRVVGRQYTFLVESNASADELQRIVDSWDLLGYEYPTLWADVRIELAQRYEDTGRTNEASEIRRELGSKLGDLYEQFGHIIDNLGK